MLRAEDPEVLDQAANSPKLRELTVATRRLQSKTRLHEAIGALIEKHQKNRKSEEKELLTLPGRKGDRNRSHRQGVRSWGAAQREKGSQGWVGHVTAQTTREGSSVAFLHGGNDARASLEESGRQLG